MDAALSMIEWESDLSLSDGDLAVDQGLETAVLISLFTDRRADEREELPAGETSRRGWWGDSFAADSDKVGSRLWLLHREKSLAEVAARAEDYAREALAWLIEDGVSDKTTVKARTPGNGALILEVSVKRPGQEDLPMRFIYNWAAQAVRRS